MFNTTLIVPSSQKNTGGIERFANSFSSFLDRKKFAVSFFYTDDLPGFFSGYKRVVTTPAFYLQRSDVVLANGFLALSVDLFLLVQFFKGNKKKIIYIPHFHPCSTHKHPVISSLYFYLVAQWIYRLDFKTVVLSDSERIFFKKMGIKKIISTRHGVSQRFIRPAFTNKRVIDFCFVGRPVQNKGLSELEKLDLLAAPNSLKIKYFFPFPPRKHTFLNSETVIGATSSEIFEELRRSKFIVIPSSYEAFSIVMVEALACGCIPIVSQNVKGAQTFLHLEIPMTPPMNTPFSEFCIEVLPSYSTLYKYFTQEFPAFEKLISEGKIFEDLKNELFPTI